jgi:anaerobic selenocysteine-containing dehydrogenase
LRYRADGFPTLSGRLEIYSERLLAVGAAPTPVVETAAHRMPPLFPLQLASAKVAQFCHSQHRGLARLRKSMPEPLAELHPETARRHEIANGDWIRISTPVGAMRARARLTRGVARDVVCAQYGWWEDCDALGLPGYALDDANCNALVDHARFDPLSGANALSGGACAIARLGPASPDDRATSTIERQERCP